MDCVPNLKDPFSLKVMSQKVDYKDNIIWNFNDVLFVSLGVVLGSMLVILILSQTKIPEYFALTISRVSLSLIMGVMSIVYLRIEKKQPLKMIGIAPCKLKYIFHAILGGIGLFFLSRFLFQFAPENCRTFTFPRTESFIWWVISCSIFAPISEELYYRGILFPACEKKCGLVKGIVLSALIFGLVHFNHRYIDIVHIIVVSNFIIGVGLTLLYHYSKSILPSILCHSIISLLVTLFTVEFG